MQAPLPSYEVVIATRNRAAVLGVSLPTLLGQSHAPERLVVVDSSDDPAPVERALSEVSRRFPVPVLMLRSEPGLCLQRNIGVRHVRAPVVFMPDDDSLWHPDAARAICRVYARDREDRVGAVCAAQAAVPPPGALADALAAPYTLRAADRAKNRLQPVRARIEHALFPDPFILHGRERIAALGVPSWLADEDAVPVEWMTGFRMTCRTDLAQRHAFDETLTGYGLFEDVDLSFSVLRTHLVVGANRASVFHYRDPSPRGDHRRLGLQQVINRAYVVGKHASPGSAARRRLLSYGVYKAMHYAAAAWRRPSRRKLAGSLAGIKSVPSMLKSDPSGLREAYRVAFAS